MFSSGLHEPGKVYAMYTEENVNVRKRIVLTSPTPKDGVSPMVGATNAHTTDPVDDDRHAFHPRMYNVVMYIVTLVKIPGLSK
ncbi:hypothetical protein F441_15413 [Phytophthora nicotianae CJ01A1]|uniref:Uncharacterized protein n=5 Tax=Phytophthora nicotianae TaxID=4792 RepID=W2R1S0_PHYN3|nr:hypothetical protein PPTG_04632 [Phytophthora nicotianae INRA-310]ETI38755.1 hypothetical protein F443_15597 [Phytophthora nicotianae P1569]ETL32401.1 hypothetical protein L916_15036 [Phytophthora nicotianae]ETO67500.1 hypothetical protein F444_15580 [Phytophthora nicotianae P1976]ETP08668.1 hypothetical protein F441_15413 [Phytophthora nicotianae CJ01A1]ETL85644.1 hypothetical protein L917_14863 [Phytophthora nicotianae]